MRGRAAVAAALPGHEGDAHARGGAFGRAPATRAGSPSNTQPSLNSCVTCPTNRSHHMHLSRMSLSQRPSQTVAALSITNR